MDGKDRALVELDRDHPDGEPPPVIEYTPEEHGVWTTVWRNLDPLHARYACAAWRDGLRRLDMSRDYVPQLRDVNRQLSRLTGFELAPVAGLVTPAIFLRELGRGVFLATQYMRHASAPLYTPEPDVVHELIGHAVSLADPTFARLNRLFGEAALALDDASMTPLINAYWYTLEFGVARGEGGFDVYGAGLLSSFGELGRFETSAEILPFDLDRIAATSFDPTDYQRQLFVAPSFASLEDALSVWLAKKRR
jgi:phenylalanine-4-hydroxylase